MAQSIVGFRVASTLGVVFCALFTGANMAISNMVIPILLLPPPKNRGDSNEKRSLTSHLPVTQGPHLAWQWQNMYNMGSKAGPVVALGSFASFVYAARCLAPAAVLQNRLLVIAAGLSVTIAPFTLLFMKSLNDEIHSRVNAMSERSPEASDTVKSPYHDLETADLLRQWARFNLV